MPNQNSQQRQGDRLVIGITGRIGAGKTSVGKYLESQHRFSYVRYSQVLSDWRAKDPESKTHLQAVGWEVMAGGMQAELNFRLISEIPPESNCAVDGLRHSLDFESLNSAFSPHFFLIYVNSSLELRWQRLQRRYPTLDDFRSADSHPVEQQIDSLRDRAFASISNNSSMKDLYSEVNDVLVRIQTGGPR
jgi:dephospho-CoA kinase